MDSVLGLVRHKGNAALFSAVEMSIVSTLAGTPLHLHAEGLRGTGKTTILRAARRVLPRIRRVKGCLYNCDPDAPHCPQHRGLDPEALARIGSEWVTIPFLEISHSAKVGTVVGSIDLGRLVSPTDPAAALLPGTLPQAHRGIVLVDEVNRLAETSPELADILLDAMGTRPGRVQIEETGLPAVEIPLVVSVWAASNPDEDPGPLEEIRRQLSDRFDFVIPTGRPDDAAVVDTILARLEGLTAAPPDEEALEACRARLAERAGALRDVSVPAWLRSEVAGLYTRFGLESLRSVQAMLRGARLSACLAGRSEATWEDLAAVAPLALHHRVDGDTLARALQHLRGVPGARAHGEGGFAGRGPGSVAVAAPATPAGALARPGAPPVGAAAPPGLATPGPGAGDAPPAAPLADRTPAAAGEGRGGQAAAAPGTAPGRGAGRPDVPPLWQRLWSYLRRRGSQAGDGSSAAAVSVDPARHPPAAPPHRARPLWKLPDRLLVSTEDDLRRRR
ncbi:hypothetical protein [Caldinitratiruptor microaerophilus]|uniref:AAA+ ATPase domain-containing protein n=1 Tax=Caldinitratiruptor microaerophilus TaxID=671077 RepID=A0AA35CL25_9FIRM|nr:hypothetical protein [Caldinitratiruptor microaerophilus]BDG59275.1 hypothetical protein caldi_03650 [Caldinitratiruptor microaerophilus]